MMRRLLPLLVLALLALPARATWSIVLVNRVTGEVVVAAATCLGNFDLLQALPVVRVGIGGAAAQSAVDTGAKNRKKIFAQLALGTPPADIIALLEPGDLLLHQFRQYGIVDRTNPPAGFTGTKAGQAKLDLAGSFGDWNYAVAGNVLTDPSVITAAVFMLENAPGDAMTKVAVAMEAARALGGDGRCSCDADEPDSCVVPPPGTWKSSHIAFFVIARPGDTDGVCNASMGCANGDYYLSLNVIGSPQVAEDPVEVLFDQLAAFRATKQGVPDHFLSRVEPAAERLVADGVTGTTVRIELVDLEGVPLTAGGAQVTVAAADGGPLLGSLSPVVDHGDGSYSFQLTAGLVAGTERLAVTVDDGSGPVLLGPPLEVPIDPLVPLHAGFESVSVAEAVNVPLTANGTPGATYLILASGSGTAPAQPVPGGSLALAADPIFTSTIVLANTPLLPNTFGVLDANGRAQGALVAPAGQLAALVGVTLDWALLELAPQLAAPQPGASLLLGP